MGAEHFLEHGFELQDADSPDVAHGLEMFTHGGRRYIRVWIGGAVANKPLVFGVTRAEAESIALAAEELTLRISD